MAVIPSRLAANPYLDKTATVPRPSSATRPGWPPALLAKHQADWDAADERREELERLRARREANERAAEEARQVARLKAEDERFVGALRARYLASDPAATEAQFQADLPELRKQHRLRAALDGDRAGDELRRYFARRGAPIFHDAGGEA